MLKCGKIQINMYAIVEDTTGLEQRERVANSHRSGDTYFYVNGNRVSVENPYFKLSDEAQKELLEWFLDDRKFEILR